MSRRARPSLRSALLLLGALALAACQPAGAQPRTAFAPETESTERDYGSHMTVGLRVTLDPESETEPRAHLVAVVHDLDGSEEVTDLGTYDGPITEEDAQEGELVRVHVEGPEGYSVTVVNVEDGVLEVRQVPDSGAPGSVRRIPIRASTPVRPSEPRFELRP